MQAAGGRKVVLLGDTCYSAAVAGRPICAARARQPGSAVPCAQRAPSAVDRRALCTLARRCSLAGLGGGGCVAWRAVLPLRNPATSSPPAGLNVCGQPEC